MDLVPILSLIILVATAVTLLLAVIAYARYKHRERQRAENSENAEAVETVERQEDAYVLATPSMSAQQYGQASQYAQPSYGEQQYDPAYAEQYEQQQYAEQYGQATQQADGPQPSYMHYADEAEPVAEPVYADAQRGAQQQAQAQAGGTAGYPQQQARAPQPAPPSYGGYGAPTPIMPEQQTRDFVEGALELDDYQPMSYTPGPQGGAGSFPEATIVPSQGPGMPGQRAAPTFSEMTPPQPPGGLRPPRTGVPQQPARPQQSQSVALDVSRSLFWEYDADDGFMPVDGHHLSQGGGKRKAQPEPEMPSESDDGWL